MDIEWVISETSFKERKIASDEFTEEEMSNIRVIPDDEYQEMIKNGFLVCPDIKPDMAKYGLPDSIEGYCNDCGKTIYYRKQNSTASRKVCPECADKIVKANQ